MAIAQGDRVGLVGPSGSGKTTLMRAIAKLDPCDSGSLLFRGDSIERDSVPAYRRQAIYLAQHPAFAEATVAENLQIPFRLDIAKSTYDSSIVESWLEQLGKPASILAQTIESLSGGEQQLISLVRALTLSPTALLLDEPTAALDAETAAKVERLIMDWYRSDESRAFVWSSHDLEQVDRMTMRQIRMDGGRVLKEKLK